MLMDTILQQLESRIDQLVASYATALSRVDELEARVAELEEQVQAGAEAEDKNRSLEQQRTEVGARLSKVLELIDGALADVPEESQSS